MIHSEKIDLYIEKAQPFAQPILRHLRKIVHQTCPEVEEKIKWGMAHFDYLGEMMCGMASFKQHCSFGFWKASLMKDPTLIANAQKEESMGHLGRICTLKDLPSDKKLVAYIKEAMALNEQGMKVKKAPKPAKPDMPIPDYFLKALIENKPAKTVFDNFSASCKREYVAWITEAKTEATRLKRMEQAIAWISEGKKRHWQYQK